MNDDALREIHGSIVLLASVIQKQVESIAVALRMHVENTAAKLCEIVRKSGHT